MRGNLSFNRTVEITKFQELIYGARATSHRNFGAFRGTPVMGMSLWGSSPLYEIGNHGKAVYQMIASVGQRLGVSRGQAIRHGISRK
jgi:hypothetical protein